MDFKDLIAGLALIVSGITAWLTFFRGGRLKMTQPATIFFGRDGEFYHLDRNKVFLRTMLYSTARRGHVLESLHLEVHRNESKQNFNVWVYGQAGDLERGSGLFIPQEGVVFNHHFLLPEDGADFKFLAGSYRLTVFAKTVVQHHPIELMDIHIDISETQATRLSSCPSGLYFDWSPDHQTYHGHVHDAAEKRAKTEHLRNFLANFP